MATIKPIEARSVHQIQSGQVIVDLCSVVKELVENSLDAGATSIDVRFKNQGLDSIEVQDNGDGISPDNYETVALKHYTSKLSTYADLTTLQTFGFRGEALSSLCALSQFSIITCMAPDAPKGTKLEFEESGMLKGKSTVAAQKGTTVITENVFNNLPVRRRELERNIKREWGRVVNVLGQYACIQTGIKFTVSQQAGKGKKTILFSTKGNQTTRDNIVNVFGAKTIAALIPLDLTLELEPTSGPTRRLMTQEDEEKTEIRIIGHISRPVSGEGRQTPDKQMFFVNARPCGLPQVAKAFNEVYKSYNASQSPFIFANIELDTHLYDVNVSPDKRTILLHDQTRMLDNLKVALTELFESQDYTVPVSQLSSQKQPSYKQLTIDRGSKAPAQTSQSSTDSAGRGGRRGDNYEAYHEGESTGGSVLPEPFDATHTDAASQEAVTRDRKAASLISNWTSRKAGQQLDQGTQSSESSVPSQGMPKESQETSEELEQDNELVDQEDEIPEDGRSFTTSDESHVPPISSSLPSVERHESAARLQPSTEAPHIGTSPESTRSMIPALHPPSKPSSTASNVFSSSPRPVRAHAEMATITIGDETITSPIGTPSRKRHRMASDLDAAESKGRSTAPGGPVPSFGSRLSQRFSAPGTTQHLALSEEHSEAATQGFPSSPPSVDGSAEGDSAVDDQEEIPEHVASQEATEEHAQSSPPEADDGGDELYIDEDEKKAREEAKVQEMIAAAEVSTAQPSQENATRAKALLKGGGKKKDTTLNVVKTLETDTSTIQQQLRVLDEALKSYRRTSAADSGNLGLEAHEAEEKLSLTISKTDFARMKIIGQFNLGFILASRSSSAESESLGDELFIIDQHASDEKYNFERLQASTIVQSQRLVRPKVLSLTALEEEIVMENKSALETNGFVVDVDQSGEAPVGSRCQVVSLPLSRETTFSLTDLDELLALLSEHPPGSIPRPSKVRKMFAMRACRSSIMIGKTLTFQQMGKVVKHLGELDKPWNCPHGRPTMRHLYGLGAWDELGWKEGSGLGGRDTGVTDWAAYVRQNRDGLESP